jgi:hypothetical protein
MKLDSLFTFCGSMPLQVSVYPHFIQTVKPRMFWSTLSELMIFIGMRTKNKPTVEITTCFSRKKGSDESANLQTQINVQQTVTEMRDGRLTDEETRKCQAILQAGCGGADSRNLCEIT